MKHNWIFNKVIQGTQLSELCKYHVIILFSLIDKTVHNSALIIVNLLLIFFICDVCDSPIMQVMMGTVCYSPVDSGTNITQQ